MEDMDKLAAEGRHVFQVSDRVEADRQFKAWEDHVGNWISRKFPESGLSAKWSSLGFSNLTWDNSVGSAQEEWHEFREMVRGRLEWLAKLPNTLEAALDSDEPPREIITKKVNRVAEGENFINQAETQGEQKLQLPLAEKVTLSWLWENVPAKFWIWSCSILLSVFLIGVYVGQMRWIQDLYRDKRTTNSGPMQKIASQGMAAKPKMLSSEELDQALKIVHGYRNRIQDIRDSINKGEKVTQDQISSLRQDYQKLIRPYVDLLQLHQPGEKEWHGYKLEYDNPLDLALTELTFFHANLSLDFLDTIIGRIEHLRSHPETE